MICDKHPNSLYVGKEDKTLCLDCLKEAVSKAISYLGNLMSTAFASVAQKCLENDITQEHLMKRIDNDEIDELVFELGLEVK